MTVTISSWGDSAGTMAWLDIPPCDYSTSCSSSSAVFSSMYVVDGSITSDGGGHHHGNKAAKVAVPIIIFLVVLPAALVGGWIGFRKYKHKDIIPSSLEMKMFYAETIGKLMLKFH